MRLLDGERPYDALSATRAGSYWNLVMPYALASGLFQPHGGEARDVLRYMLTHGSRLLGLVRAGGYALYGDAPFPTSGTDQVYGLSMSRFLADNDRPDQLVLSLYGQLAAGMTRGTFVAGEAASVAPLDGERYRTMFLPPNGTSNAAFLETLRLVLVHETTGADGSPQGLELAYATPRAWLAPGKEIAVRIGTDELRPGVVLDPLDPTGSAGLARRAGSLEAPTPDAPAAPARRQTLDDRLGLGRAGAAPTTWCGDDLAPRPPGTCRARRARRRSRGLEAKAHTSRRHRSRAGLPSDGCFRSLDGGRDGKQTSRSRSLDRGYWGNIPPKGDGWFGQMPTA